jgi:hypothetical protein
LPPVIEWFRRNDRARLWRANCSSLIALKMKEAVYAVWYATEQLYSS